MGATSSRKTRRFDLENGKRLRRGLLCSRGDSDYDQRIPAAGPCARVFPRAPSREVVGPFKGEIRLLIPFLAPINFFYFFSRAFYGISSAVLREEYVPCSG